MEQLGLGPADSSNGDYVAQNPVLTTMAKETNMEVCCPKRVSSIEILLGFANFS